MVCRSSEYRPEGTRVTVCTLDEDFVTDFARGVPREGPHTWNTDDGSLVWPTCITLDSQETLYISDEWLNRISMFSKDGEYLGKWEERSGTGDGEMDRPSGLVFDADDNVLIVDSGNNRVQKFTKDGQFISKWGTGGAGQGELNMPWESPSTRRATSTSQTGEMTAFRNSLPTASLSSNSAYPALETAS